MAVAPATGKASGFLVRSAEIGKLTGAEDTDPLATDHAMLVVDLDD